MPVFQWHGDAFELPAGAVALASSPQCTHQAFRYGERVYGLLFHLELVPAMIHSWLATFQEELAGVQAYIDPQRIVADMPRYLEQYQQVSTQIFTNLVDHVWTPLATGAKSFDDGKGNSALARIPPITVSLCGLTVGLQKHATWPRNSVRSRYFSDMEDTRHDLCDC